ncbi:hypothetical protein NNL21_00830 [Paenibacillus mendelii]|nr:hypothetical protein [Paenibacillus mendelii]
MIQYAFDNLDIVAVDTHNAKEWKVQVAPLYELGFKQITKDEWGNRIR